MINQSLGLFARHTFVAIAWHVWGFRNLLALEDYVDQLLFGKTRIKLLLRGLSVTSNALRFVVRRRIRRLYVRVCPNSDEQSGSKEYRRCYAICEFT